ncbi:MAG: HoxN/HupN/NixA family nickel/cobalt transporter, partial [Gemmataceae bacterium]
FHGQPLLLGTAFLAYSFGLRHAFDADHIAAIDNVTRKLMQEGKRPVAVGFFFSLGHSTVVVGLAVAIALTTAALQGHFDALKNIGGTIGTSVSALFLFAIAAANILVLVQVYRAFKFVTTGQGFPEEDIDEILSKRGFLGRLLRPLFSLIKRSWHMYPLGFLFGLGFDTATEVGLLGISATQASQGLSLWSILVFPALFTAGMSLMDTSDGLFMNLAYGWAFFNPVRKVYYNLAITGLSVAICIFIGGIETLSLVPLEVHGVSQTSGFWGFMYNFNINTAGFVIVGMFIVTWAAAMLIWKYGRIEERWSARLQGAGGPEISLTPPWNGAETAE